MKHDGTFTQWREVSPGMKVGVRWPRSAQPGDLFWKTGIVTKLNPCVVTFEGGGQIEVKSASAMRYLGQAG